MIDTAVIQVKSGKGGDGAVSFRREKYVARGGPDGGDGGEGGDVVLVGERNLRTLDYFASRERFEAEAGGEGSKRRRKGGDSEDLRIDVPLGSVVYQYDGDIDVVREKSKLFELLRSVKSGLGVMHKSGGNHVTTWQRGNAATLQRGKLRYLGEIITEGQRLVVARGGHGGRGNDAFKSSTNQVPREFERGTPGEEKWLVLELKLLADVGLVGLPNAGKSTMLSVLTKARPKIAGYEFTTTSPNLGVMRQKSKIKNQKSKIRSLRRINKELVVADIPGLIEGASKGKGLGDEFLRHVERCQVLIHVVGLKPDQRYQKSKIKNQNYGVAAQLYRDYETVRKELKDYHGDLVEKEEIVVVNKIDLFSEEMVEKLKTDVSEYFSRKGVKNVLFMSGVTGEGLEELRERISESD